MKTKQESVWKALADPTRRKILDLLGKEPRTTGDLSGHFKLMTRYGVMKHLSVLEESGLVLTRREGRLKWHFLNAVPIQKIYDRWVSKYVGRHSRMLIELKKHSERTNKKQEK